MKKLVILAFIIFPFFSHANYACQDLLSLNERIQDNSLTHNFLKSNSSGVYLTQNQTETGYNVKHSATRQFVYFESYRRYSKSLVKIQVKLTYINQEPNGLKSPRWILSDKTQITTTDLSSGITESFYLPTSREKEFRTKENPYIRKYFGELIGASLWTALTSLSFHKNPKGVNGPPEHILLESHIL